MAPPSQTGAGSTGQNRPLPPSVEMAYYRKCIELKRRINEVEASNDAARLRKARVERSVLKLRLERAFLLEKLAERMDYNVDDSDDSQSPPPEPQDKPLRHKRARKASPAPAAAGPSSLSQASPPAGTPFGAQNFSAAPTPDARGQLFFSSTAAGPATPANGTPAAPTPGQAQSPIRFRPTTGQDNDDAEGAINNSTQQTHSLSEQTQEQEQQGSHQENGEHPKPYAGAQAGQTTEAEAPEAALENGQPAEPQDVEMAEADTPGFASVNRA